MANTRLAADGPASMIGDSSSWQPGAPPYGPAAEIDDMACVARQAAEGGCAGREGVLREPRFLTDCISEGGAARSLRNQAGLWCLYKRDLAPSEVDCTLDRFVHSVAPEDW